MNILLTGGTGFIGSHTAVELITRGHKAVLYDNLCNSDAAVVDALEKITGKRPLLVVGDIRDTEKLQAVLIAEIIDVVIHFAGLKAVGESCVKPLEYYDNNVGGTVSLLKAMHAAGLTRIIFSSSSTVYGTPQYLPLTEEHPVGGVTNPYGRTKLFIEDILKDVCAARPDFTAVCLRYFNPIGAHASGLIGENPNGIPNNLLPYVARVASGRLARVGVFGNDYPTKDGTGVRDYIHVVDLARGHALACDKIESLKGWEAVNLGTGTGYSVLEIIHAFEKACGHPIPYEIKPRRAGDIAANWADAAKAKALLGWQAQLSLDDMCRDAWHYEQMQAAAGK